MTHSDDVGFVCPPLLAPVQVVIVPIWRKDTDRASVLEVGTQIANELRAAGHRVKLDDRDDLKPGAKYYEWEGRGVPVRLEIGPRDVERNQVVVAARTGGKNATKIDGLSDSVKSTLSEIQRTLFERAYARQEANSHRGLDRSAFVDLMNDVGGFVYSGFCGDQECEMAIKEATKATIRVLPDEEFRSKEVPKSCLWCEKASVSEALWGKAY